MRTGCRLNVLLNPVSLPEEDLSMNRYDFFASVDRDKQYHQAGLNDSDGNKVAKRRSAYDRIDLKDKAGHCRNSLGIEVPQGPTVKKLLG